MTQLEYARGGEITEIMKRAAEKEGRDIEFIRAGVAAGTIVVPANAKRGNLDPHAIGEGLFTKVNANIGTSPERGDIETEIRKARTAVEAGAHALMDLSTGGDLVGIRERIMASASVPFGTVPAYEAARRTIDSGKKIPEMDPEVMFSIIREQAEQGVDFMTIHCGITLESVERLKKSARITKVVSRGGAFTVSWMMHNLAENPLYERFDEVLEIALAHDVTLSLGDGMRPGCLADATDASQIQELVILGELAARCRDAGVQVMVEGPGHVPLNQVAANMMLAKQLCGGAPFYVLGPIVTDVAPGYDHITSAIGGAIAASSGADFLCYVTPSEHLSLPDEEDVRAGVMAARIAAHAADIAKGVPGAIEWDIKMAKCRINRDWGQQIELAIDSELASKYRQQDEATSQDVCSMCGEFCSMKGVESYL
ncbi:phosphomethylpyrimidine synthase ThiC [Candidatus Hydrogenedentota bacterium]